MYAKGFEEALKNMHNASCTVTVTSASDGPTMAGGHVIVVTTASGMPLCFAPTNSTAIQTIEKATAALRSRKGNAWGLQMASALPPLPLHSQPQPAVAPVLPNPQRIVVPLPTAAGSGSELSRPSSGASGSIDSSMDSPYGYNQIHIKEEKEDLETSGTRKPRRRTASSPPPSSSHVYPINLEDQVLIFLLFFKVAQTGQ
jgi:hypothetical protein